MLGQFTGEEQPDGRLDLPAGDGRSLVVMSEPGSFGGNALEDVVDEAVHDAHRLAGDAGVRVNLLQHLVDVNCVALLPPPLLLFVSLGDVLLGLSGLFGGFSTCLWRHVADRLDGRDNRRFFIRKDG